LSILFSSDSSSSFEIFSQLALATEFVPATAIFQANSCQQGERHCTYVVIAVDCLTNGVHKTRQLAAGFFLSRQRPLLVQAV